MRIKEVRLHIFKRFDDLTISLGDDSPRIVAMVGPNGCGKSSVFDAFEEQLSQFKGNRNEAGADFYNKGTHYGDEARRTTGYDRGRAIQITTVGNVAQGPESFYIRNAYRFTPNLNLTTIGAMTDLLEDDKRPGNSISLDQRGGDNYARLQSQLLDYGNSESELTPARFREELIGSVNSALRDVLDIEISDLGNVPNRRGQLYFAKGNVRDFPYKNLSAGEKEVVDILLDIIIKREGFKDTVYCIDEPELHLNTGIQRALLNKIVDLLPEDSQLWIATHSIGFLRALQEDLHDETAILDFGERDYFDTTATIEPMRKTRSNWSRVLEVALEDLTGLLAPKRIIYCEGRPLPGAEGTDTGFDASIYNLLFAESRPETLFVSAGGTDLIANATVALAIVGKAFTGVELWTLRDRDTLNDEQRQEVLQDPMKKVLLRRDIENYLYDPAVLGAYCVSKDRPFDAARYAEIVPDVVQGDMKPVRQRLAQSCGWTGPVASFAESLCDVLANQEALFHELETTIFD